MAARPWNGEDRDQLIETLRGEMGMVLQSLETLLSEEEPAVAVDGDPRKMARMFEQLAVMLEDMDPGCLRAGERADSQPAKYRGCRCLGCIGKQVGQFEFDQALATLDELKRQFDGKRT